MGHFWLLLQLYGGVYNLFRSGLPRMGIDVTMVDIFDLNDLKKCLRSQTKLVWLEACTNPLVMLADLGRDHLLSYWRFVALVYDSMMKIWSVCHYFNQWRHSLEIFVSFISFFVLFLVTFGDEVKGQLISKANDGLLTSPKKRTDEFVLFTFLLFMASFLVLSDL